MTVHFVRAAGVAVAAVFAALSPLSSICGERAVCWHGVAAAGCGGASIASVGTCAAGARSLLLGSGTGTGTVPLYSTIARGLSCCVRLAPERTRRARRR